MKQTLLALALGPLAEMATKGCIGLQGAHGGIPTHFRNLKIKSLD